jgi:hypothetical protein
VDRGDRAERREKPRRPGPVRVHGQDVLYECGAHGHRLAVAVEGEAPAVEDELVVGPDLVDEDERPAVLAGVAADEAEADLLFAGVEGRGRDVDEQRRAWPASTLTGRRRRAAPAATGARPGILADRDAQTRL